MDKETISILSNIVIAISTFIGVGAALVYYLTEILGSNTLQVILVEAEYFLVVLIFLIIIKRNINKE